MRNNVFRVLFGNNMFVFNPELSNFAILGPMIVTDCDYLKTGLSIVYSIFVELMSLFYIIIGPPMITVLK